MPSHAGADGAIDKAVRLREIGLTVREIANVMDVPASTVGDWVKGIIPLEYEEIDALEETDEDRRLKMLRAFCTRCRQQRSWAEFWAKAKWPDGTMRVPQSHCKDCTKEARKRRRRENPEWARALDRRDWQRIVSDQKKHARRREIQRENSKVFRLRRSEGDAA